MKKRILTTLFASLVCLGLSLQQARAGNPRGFTAPAQPDLEITQAKAESGTTVSFTIVSHGEGVPANTVTIAVLIRLLDSKAWFYDFRHDYVIGQALAADQPASFTIELPQEKEVASRRFNLLIDPDNKVNESNEKNNVTQAYTGPPKSYNFPDPPSIDLELMQWSFVDETTVSLKVISRKKPSPAGSFEVWVTTMNKDGTPAWEKQATFPVDIPADKLATMEFKAPEGKDFVGKKFRVVVDYGGKVPEHNETNNYSGTYTTTVLDQVLKADVKFKEAIYYKLGQPDSQAGTPTAPLKIKKSETTCCTGGLRTANITFRILMTPADKPAHPTFKVTNISAGESINYSTSITLEPGQTSIDKTFPVGVKDGENKMKFELGSSFSFKDTDPTNNTLEITINLMADK